ncbi:MATE family efflux transporter [Candidatus Epulonipiscium fishelsonii]|uniref:MATE family efflux transporter n=1 Tax=Candidatus Epulonipiscium fishelsonii TaxID=77094 RepID=A0ACC8XEX8_9FIRM|nr:MATE family efflux transporter [Epulopiscium sp. SCG-B05WGA-EpuloA1]ONI41944.1 MATE family efflux transporter [Epulopiscium sp. SCG-B11WGA-EpuloA1]
MKKIDLTQGNVLKVLGALAVPLMGSSFLQFTYNLVDMMWVGRLGVDAVASVGASSFFITLGISLNSMIVIGGGIKVSHALGRNDEEDTKKYVNTSIILNAILIILYSTLLLICGKSFIGFLELQNQKVEYDAWLYLMYNIPIVIFSFYNILFSRFFGSFGNNSEAFKINAIGVIINIVLDPIFIYTFNFGIIGAALATLIANIIIFILFIYRGKNFITFHKNISTDYVHIKEVIRLGFPMTFQRVLFTGVNIMLAKIVAQFGAEAIAAQKIGLQIESITYMIVGGLQGAMASFSGQNFGAQKYDRIKKGYNDALIIGIGYTFVTSILFLSIPEVIVRLFITEEIAVQMAADYLKTIAHIQLFGAIEMISNGLFTGIGIPKVSATISIIFTVLRIPMAVIFSNYLGIGGVWLSIGVSSALKGTVAYIYYFANINKVFLLEKQA